jgi:hypothetical protein
VVRTIRSADRLRLNSEIRASQAGARQSNTFQHFVGVESDGSGDLRVVDPVAAANCRLPELFAPKS